VDALDDRADCEELMHYLIDALDDADWDKAVTFLTEDFEYVQSTSGALVAATEVKGKGPFLEMIKRVDLTAKTSQHYIANVALRVNGDEARALARDFVAHVFTEDGQSEVVYTGSRLEFRFRRTPHGWMVSRLEGAPVWRDPRFPLLLKGDVKPGR
jgi:SnoaL-like domain